MAKPAVLFVCVKNGGKSQMAAGLMRAAVGDTADIYSAGTRPGTTINSLAAESLLEVGVDITGERPQPIDPQLVRDVDIVITLGREAQVSPVPGTAFENWDTDEPSQRGIDGIERMRLVRDDIAARVADLASQLTTSAIHTTRGNIMSTIEVFEPALCCSTGVCGENLDQALVTFSADLDWIRSQGGDITRFNLASEPLAFTEREPVTAFLQLAGSEGLPLVLVDGVTAQTGRYPDRAQLAKWAGLAVPAAVPAGITMLGLTDADACCSDDAANPTCC